jgi:Na+/H+ antiporter NhaD/arsenite permease-like protein
VSAAASSSVLAGLTAVLSNVVSNVPAVILLKPFVAHLPHPEHGWLTLAMASTLAGNLTLLGSIANLIVVERARHIVKISFFEYLKAGVPLTILTITSGILVLWL